jgi:hypothetical protein
MSAGRREIRKLAKAAPGHCIGCGKRLTGRKRILCANLDCERFYFVVYSIGRRAAEQRRRQPVQRGRRVEPRSLGDAPVSGRLAQERPFSRHNSERR